MCVFVRHNNANALLMQQQDDFDHYLILGAHLP